LRKLTLPIAALAALTISALTPISAEAGCYRLGLSGYHWYSECIGPHFMYPHRRVCRYGHCWYR
jgi:hypothetical protein